jgi:serine/threonine-protein kinase
MVVTLRIVEGPEAGREVRVPEAAETSFGRDDPRSNADVRLGGGDMRLSRRHFAIAFTPADCVLRDLGSGNGTFVRAAGGGGWGERVTDATLRDGDEIRAGDTVFRVIMAAESDAAPGDAESSALRMSFGDVSVVAPEPGSGSDQGEPSAWHCRECGRDVSDAADADGRVAELSEATYLCRSCAERQRDLPRQTIGGYLLLTELGRGGMGVVYKALHESTGRLAAVKQVLPVALTADGRARFLRELSILHDLTHPLIVRFYDAGFHDEKPYFISELCFGGDLDQFVAADGRPLLEPAAAVALTSQALRGLEHMHGNGFVHRDLKPANLLLKDRGEPMLVKLADCGFARSYEEHGGTISREGEFAGTWMFMPLEQLMDFRNVRPVSDVYALGTTLFYLLSGRFPLGFPTPWQIAAGMVLAPKDPVATIKEDEPRSLAEYRPDLPAPLVAAIDTATRRDAAGRFQTAAEFRDELDKLVL